ncbi:restriction endonuclease [Bradyrhizobium uaiense]|uniref:Restriction endonuclease n=1 Tax=Bradyrhizobium uaiense TaxID=2594946 RepID=A0A6P1BCL9_9BRAD|nr:restriction endonuclease [Bradyrhizobium uaiense]NEU96033.1 restriction endonuclease [Bradyrhizobium uaiense]
MNFLILAGAVLLVIGYGAFLVIQGLLKGVDAASKAVADQRQATANKRAERLAHQEYERSQAYRAENPVRLVGIPNPHTFRHAFSLLDDYVATATAYRPVLPSGLDTRFRAYRFPSQMFELARPHPASLSNTDPRKVSLTPADVLMGGGADMSSLYGRAAGACDFPCAPPTFGYTPAEAPTPKPNFPSVTAPHPPAVRLVASDGRDVDGEDELQAKAFEAELQRVAALNAQAWELDTTFHEKYAAAIEARDLMEIYLADLSLKWTGAQAALLGEFEQMKVAYERDCQRATQPIRAVNERYRKSTNDGVRGHFELALCNITLPVPEDYPWEVLYDPQERVLQVNQCVPSLPDVSVVRSDGKRPPAKRDAEAVLRRYVPAVALQIAHHVARNDLQDDVDRIAVNCWSRFYDPVSGKLKDAFVAALAVDKRDITEFNLQRADALEAFRALKGAYVYSVAEVVPIEPAIRLDKDDERFVAGRDVLDGMAQGQNLAAMDWQDFEHLIRELLAKEYADKNAEVKITRASRDRGVDAVIFNSDPLHGGKFVVQAKRYSNTVDVAAVRELYGTVLNEGANRGILVTTSHFGRDAYEWAANKPLTLIDGRNLLALLSKHGYNFRIEALP